MEGSPTYFTSKMQATVNLSSTEAEYIVLGSIAQRVIFQRKILNKLQGGKYNKVRIIYEDNLGAIYLIKNPQISQRTKHIDVRHHFIRNLVKKKINEIQFIKSENNVVDISTKNVKEETFNKHAKKINNSKVRYNKKEKHKVNYENYETEEDQIKEAKREGVKMYKDDHSLMNTNE